MAKTIAGAVAERQSFEKNFTVYVRVESREIYRADYETWRASEDDYNDLVTTARTQYDSGITQNVEVVKLKDGELAARWSSARYAEFLGAKAEGAVR